MEINKFMLFLVASVLISGFSQVLLKKSAQIHYDNHIREYLNIRVILGYGMMVLATITTLLAYHFGVEYKNGPVVESLGYLLVMVLSRFFFDERITKRKLVGNLVILIGIIVFYL